jgi:hypothetical protein
LEVKLSIETLRDGSLIANARIGSNAHEPVSSLARMADRAGGRRIRRWIGVGVAASFLLAGAATAIAGTRNANFAYCNGLVSAKNLKTAAERDAEREKCRKDPYTYK